jgi:hypothetical protein
MLKTASELLTKERGRALHSSPPVEDFIFVTGDFKPLPFFLVPHYSHIGKSLLANRLLHGTGHFESDSR